MKHKIILVLLLTIFWLISSGYFLPLLLALGAISVGFIVWLMRRVDAIDGICYPVILFSWRLPGYLLWLAGEIIKTNLEVVRCIWSPRSISPTVIRLKSSQQTDTARALYANCITMTPGTVTLDVDGDTFEVHALTKSGAEDLQAGEMDRRIQRLET